jgi:N-acetylglutamate synthase-like GNAT family acetyltransferase
VQSLVLYKTLTLTSADEIHLTSLASVLNEYVSFGLADKEYMTRLLTDCCVYIALDEGGLIGTVTVNHEKDFDVIQHLVVINSHRSRGIGGALLSLALSNISPYRDVKAEGWKKPSGWDAESLFMKAGFVITSVVDGYWESHCSSSDYCPYYTSRCNCSCKLVIRHGKR